MYQEIITRVEGTLKTLGIDPSEAKVDEGQYNISKDKDVEVMIDVWKENELVFFQVMTPVVKNASLKEEDLYRILLEENHGLVEAAFTIINKEAFIKETIECSVFFSQERALSAITRIAFYGEVYHAKWSTAG
jgi:hypothetical protein